MKPFSWPWNFIHSIWYEKYIPNFHSHKNIYCSVWIQDIFSAAVNTIETKKAFESFECEFNSTLQLIFKVGKK